MPSLSTDYTPVHCSFRHPKVNRTPVQCLFGTIGSQPHGRTILFYTPKTQLYGRVMPFRIFKSRLYARARHFQTSKSRLYARATRFRWCWKPPVPRYAALPLLRNTSYAVSCCSRRCCSSMICRPGFRRSLSGPGLLAAAFRAHRFPLLHCSRQHAAWWPLSTRPGRKTDAP